MIATEAVSQPIFEELERKLSQTEAITKYMLAGRATFTLRSVATQKRYTFKVTKAKKNLRFANAPVSWFVSRMYGPDNETCFRYIGMLNAQPKDAQWMLRTTRNSAETQVSVPVMAFNFMLKQLQALPALTPGLEFWHSGRCGRCGKKLTVPESIERGLGPECAGKQ
jgi:hypothetical protein